MCLPMCPRSACCAVLCSATARASLFMLFNTALGSYIVGTITVRAAVELTASLHILAAGWHRTFAGHSLCPMHGLGKMACAACTWRQDLHFQALCAQLLQPPLCSCWW